LCPFKLTTFEVIERRSIYFSTNIQFFREKISQKILSNGQVKDLSIFSGFSKNGLDFLNGIVPPFRFEKVVYGERGYGEPEMEGFHGGVPRPFIL
jgi:hypothetical protein